MNNYCYWLLPAAEDSAYLQKIINELAKKHSATSFLPHLTLYPFKGIDQDKALLLLQKAVQNISPFSITTEKVYYSEQFFKTVFIEIFFTKELELINDRLTTDLKKLNNYEFKPHISLLYKDYILEQKQKTAKSVTVKEHFLMDKVALVDIGKDVFNIENWKIIFSQDL